MTDKERLDLMVMFLTESHLDIHGGYPHDYVWIGSMLIVADLDDVKERHRTRIVKYTKKQLLSWCRRAERAATKDPDGMIEDYLWDNFK